MSAIRSATRPHPIITTLVCVASFVGAACIAAPAAAAAVPLRVHLALSTRSTTVGHSVGATVRGTVPRGDHIKTIRLNWADGSKPSTVAALGRKATHRYRLPGRYAVHVRIVDKRNRAAHATATVVVSESAGSYSGITSQGRAVSFFVAFTGRSLQEVSVPVIDLVCTPGGAANFDRLAIATIPVSAGGAFHATRTQTGVFSGQPAHFTYTFAGHFHAPGVTGAPTAAGTFRETVKFTDTVARTCTSNTRSWTVTREAQPTQRRTPAPVGSYTGGTSQGRALSLFVSFSHSSLQQVTIPVIDLSCVPGGAGTFDKLAFPSIAVNAAGAFSAVRTQSGVFSGQRATFSYSFSGNFHSLAPSGAPRAAGMYRETVKFTDTAPRTCTSDNQTWAVTRDAQPAQRRTAPSAGSYAGLTSQGRSLGFAVPPSRTAVQDVSIPVIDLSCVPGGAATFDQLAIASIPVDVNGAFHAVRTQTGIFSGQPATFTLTFAGNFHSLAPNGTPRAAGMYRETVTFTDTVARSCTSDDQTWTTLKTG